MLRISANICIFICATLLTAKCILGQLQQQHHHSQKPWPTYSLQNMPQTRFTCHDKILGGYYADAETQCQMFHVCVKVAGGVQDFRFLCPNSTAFDQEAQICADWGDVDCEQSVLYYGSDNFDLYRIGSGFESKRAPLAEEEEATFHLQRAESADTRRSKETRVDQKLRPDQPPNYAKHFAATTRNPHNYANLAAQRNPQKNNYNNYNNNNNNNDDVGEYDVKRVPEAVAKQPIVNYYTPTTTTTTTTTKKPTTTSTTERNNDESKQDFEDIFKGSHSSNFFANRNGGREDDFHDHSTKTKYNDFNDYSPKSLAETSTTGKTRVHPTRGHSRRIQKPQQTPSTITTTTQNTAPPTKTTKKFSQQAHYQNSDIAGITQHYKTTTVKPAKPSTILTTARPSDPSSNFNYRSNFNAHDYQTQDKIQPTTYNPVNSAYRLKTATPKYTELEGGGHEVALQKPSKAKIYIDQYQIPTGFGKIASNQARRKSNSHGLVSPQNSTFVNKQEFSEFSKIPNAQDPHPFQPAKVFRPPLISKPNENEKTATNQTELRSRSRGQPIKSRDYQEPAPFSAANHNQKSSNAQNKLKLKTSTSPSPPVNHQQPRGFASRGSINYKATTTRGDFNDYNNFYTPTSNAPKKFSTLVPKEQTYPPTTFKPTTYKKSYENSYFELQQKQQHQNQQTGRPQSFSTTQVPTTTADPYHNPDEDDGQYHPELYEQDFPKNKLKQHRTKIAPSSPPTTTVASKSTNYPQSHLKTQQQTFFQKQQQQKQLHDTASDSADLSDEDELFKTAHSLNFGAASINKLRADILKAEKTSQQYNSQYALNQHSSSPPTGAPSYLPTTSTSSYSYPTYASTSTTFSNTNKPFTAFTTTPATTTLKTTTRPITTTTTIRPSLNTQAPTAVTAKSHHKSSGKKSSGKHKKTHKAASKRPPHADEDTSYDYAYYDSDTLSESPQEYPEYEISEFTKTRKN